MTEKAQIVAELGETAVLLPNLLASGLRANDRVKYYMSLMQACGEHAARPDEAPPNLRAEREASGEDDERLDEVVSGSRAGFDDAILVPHAGHIHEQILRSIEQMFAPRHVAGDGLVNQLETYEHRFGVLRDHLPAVTEDTIPAGYIETVTRAERKGADSLRLLVMDLHHELKRTPWAALHIAVDLVRSHLISPEEAMERLRPHDIESIQRLRLAPDAPRCRRRRLRCRSSAVARIIDGRRPVKGAGGGEMPVWGDAFQKSTDGASADEKIRRLVAYLESIQAKP